MCTFKLSSWQQHFNVVPSFQRAHNISFTPVSHLLLKERATGYMGGTTLERRKAAALNVKADNTYI
jgi:hypothetical protein